MDHIEFFRREFNLRYFEHLDDENTNHVEKLIIELILDRLDTCGDDEINAIDYYDILRIKDIILNDNELAQLFDKIVFSKLEEYARDWIESSYYYEDESELPTF